MTEHILKTNAEYWEAVRTGEKMFEVRRNDRGFQIGDALILRRQSKDAVGNFVEDRSRDNRPYELRCRVTYVLPGGQFGIDPDYVVLGMASDEHTERLPREPGGNLARLAR